MTSMKGEGSKSQKDDNPTRLLVNVPASYFRRKDVGGERAYDWKDYLVLSDLLAAKSSSFKHMPLLEEWRNIEYGLLKSRTFVEILHSDIGDLAINPKKIYWIGEVLKVAGYKALIRPLGITEKSADYWVNLCSSEVYPVGTLADRNMTLLPPQSMEQRDNEFWKGYIMEILSKNQSIPGGLPSKMKAEMMSRFTVGLRVEVVDKKRLSHVRPATVEQVIGRRLKLMYDGDSSEDFWCADQSQWLHPVGWAKSVNHALIANVRYHERCEKRIKLDDDAPLYLFQSHSLHPMQDRFDEGMKLEVIDPLNLKEICAATIYQILQHGYILLRVDSYEDEKPSNRFCVHVSSPNVFYVGFCEEHGISLSPPHGQKRETFDWITYMKQTGTRPVTKEMIRREEINHSFSPGMKLETVDLMNPHLICVATVFQVVGRLLRIRFDGWGEDYDQWLDCRSPDLYPIGWCEVVGFQLTGPPLPEPDSPEPPRRSGRRSASESPPPTRRKARPKRGKVVAPLSPTTTRPKRGRKRKLEVPVVAEADSTSKDWSRLPCPKNTVGIPKPKRARMTLNTSASEKAQIEKVMALQVTPGESGGSHVSIVDDTPKARKSFPTSKKKKQSLAEFERKESASAQAQTEALRTEALKIEALSPKVECPAAKSELKAEEKSDLSRNSFYILEMPNEDKAAINQEVSASLVNK